MKLSLQLIRAVGWCCVVAIIVLSLLPGTLRPEPVLAAYVERSVGFPRLANLSEHLLAYAITGCILCHGYRSSGARLALLAMLIVLAGTLETMQLWVIGRSPTTRDFGASSIGACAGMLATVLGERARSVWARLQLP